MHSCLVSVENQAAKKTNKNCNLVQAEHPRRAAVITLAADVAGSSKLFLVQPWTLKSSFRASPVPARRDVGL